MDIGLLKANVFPGESGGDYNALFGYSNRDGGPFSNVRLTDMTIDDALKFSDPSGPYGQWVKGKVGRVATPMGAFQVVGSTLRDAKKALGMTGTEKMDEATQDRIAQWIYQTQGPGAWEGWSNKGGSSGMAPQQRPTGPTISTSGAAPQMQASPQADQPFWKDPDFWDRLAIGFSGLSLNPNQALIQTSAQRIQDRSKTRQTEKRKNQTVEALRKVGAPSELIQLAEAGYGKEAITQAMRMMQPQKQDQTAAMQNYQFLVSQGVDPDEARSQAFSKGTTVNVGGAEATPFQETVDKKFAERYLDWKSSGAADASQQVAQISSVLSKLEDGEPLTGPMVGAIQSVGLGAILTPDAQDARDRVESVVQRSLRETLGAQFTAAEGDRLIARSYNPSLRPEQNAARLRALYSTLSAADKAKRAMIEYVEQNGTLAGYSGPRIPSASEIEAEMDKASSFGGAVGGQDGLSDEELIRKYGG